LHHYALPLRKPHYREEVPDSAWTETLKYLYDPPLALERRGFSAKASGYLTGASMQGYPAARSQPVIYMCCVSAVLLGEAGISWGASAQASLLAFFSITFLTAATRSS